MPAVADGLDIGDPASPLNLLVGQGVEQDPTKVSADHLGTAAGAVVGLTSALLHYIIGASGQNATNSRSPAALGDRQHFLDTVARHWEGLNPKEYAFTRTAAGQLRVHDDRAEFLAGIDLILAGMMASH